MADSIDRFNGDYFFLSNMCPTDPFQVGNYVFKSSENFYMAMKFMDSKIREAVSLKSPRESKVWATNKKRSDRRNIRVDWLDVQLDVMEFALRQKFNQQKFRDLLISTGNIELIEGNTWNDIFWGVDLKDPERPGQNHLGRLLMKIRSELLANPSINLFENYTINRQRPQHGEIIVINRRKESEDVYVGRGSGLGNPYAVHNGDFSHDDSMRLFEDHFYNNVLHDPKSLGYNNARKIMLWIKNGYDVKLGCYCKKFTSDDPRFLSDPTVCHASIIKRILENEISLNP